MCTDFMLRSTGSDATIISGRTMDFTAGTPFNLTKFPVGAEVTLYKSPTQIGTTVAGKYGYVGLSRPVPDSGEIASDGMNTQGLSVGVLWFSYSDYDGGPVISASPRGESAPASAEILEAPLLSNYLLGLCATVADVKRELDKINVWFPEKLEDESPLHLSVRDAAGDSLVVEFLNGERIYYKNNDIGVLTNGPTFDWHSVHYNYLYKGLTSKDNDVNQYVQLVTRSTSVPYSQTVGNGFEYEVLAAGMIGLPGDSTSPSRFVRAAKLIECFPPLQANDGKNGVQYAIQVLGRVWVCEEEVLLYFNSLGKPDRTKKYNPTIWGTIRNHTDCKYYYYLHSNHNLQAIDLNSSTLDFNDGKQVSVPMPDNAWCNDITDTLASS